MVYLMKNQLSQYVAAKWVLIRVEGEFQSRPFHMLESRREVTISLLIFEKRGGGNKVGISGEVWL